MIKGFNNAKTIVGRNNDEWIECLNNDRTTEG